MNTFFIRHTDGIDIDASTRQRLWQEHRIAIHYPHQKTGELGAEDISSISLDDYTGSGRRCMRALLQLAQDGGYVCAEHYGQDHSMLGFVEPQSKIELFHGKWGDTGYAPGRKAVLKTLALSKVKFVRPLDYAVIAVGRPRQGTIMRWYRAGKTIECLVEGRTITPTLSQLSTPQQETLCAEFLRLPQAASLGLPRLAHLLLPVGHTMRDIDIIGLAEDGRRIVAQVTFDERSTVAWKMDRLLPYKDASQPHLLLFCTCAEHTQEDGISVFPIGTAYEIFTGTPLGKLWLERSV